MSESEPEMKVLAPEAIEALLNKSHSRSGSGKSKAPQREPWKPSQDPLYRKQIGPIVYREERNYCVSGHFAMIGEKEEYFSCRVPTYITFQGIPYCATHCLQLANQMLVAKGVLS
jgi:hypothetical protein